MENHIGRKMEEIRRAVEKRAREESPVTETPADCPLCGDRGIVYEDGQARVCSCMQQKRLETMFRHARISGEYRDKRFGDFSLDYYPGTPLGDGQGSLKSRARDCLAAARRFVDDVSSGDLNARGMYIYGSVGSGKTLLAACIANELIHRKVGVLFVVVPDLLDELKATFSLRSEKEEITLMDSIRNAPVLILDDLGMHNYSEWTAGRIYNIVNYRVNQGLPTVMTSNFSLGELAHHLDERTSSRIVQLCKVYRLEVDQDIRVKRYLVR